MPNIQTAQAPVLSLCRPIGVPCDNPLQPRAPRLNHSGFCGHIPLMAVSWLCLLAALPAHAAETSFGEETLATWLDDEKENRAMASFEVNTSVLPSVNNTLRARTPSERGGATASYNAVQHLDVTRWLSQDPQSRFGLTLGLSAPTPFASAPFAPMATGTGSQSAPQLDLGLRWRSELQRGRHLDVSAWAQAPDAASQIWQTQSASYGTRVEVQWASSRTRGLMPEFGAIGVQLQGGSKLVLRARKGGPMLYYRAKF
jgi:hypothetical protein